jgi:hypothetical protein
MSPTTSEIGPSRHFAAAQQRGRFRSQADWLKERKGTLLEPVTVAAIHPS